MACHRRPSCSTTTRSQVMNLSRFHWLSGRPWMRITLVAILLVSALGVSGVAPTRWAGSAPAVAYAEKIDVPRCGTPCPRRLTAWRLSLSSSANRPTYKRRPPSRTGPARMGCLLCPTTGTANRTQPIVLGQLTTANGPKRRAMHYRGQVVLDCQHGLGPRRCHGPAHPLRYA